MKHDTSKSKIQGEGDYDSAKKYNEQAHAFSKSGKVEQAAKQAAPRNAQEKSELWEAEQEGRSHAKGEQRAEGKSKTKKVDNDMSSPGRKPEKKAPGKSGTLGKPVSEKLPAAGR
ncbi:MAG: hypothetical protein GZ085_01270 [Sulfuriferula multivorans]|uniref:Uncharacterized protein n=1 Tax=Sulfuriferula multivorans TaxID=1559896 RepID=A0A7C9NQ12_9PROT|nr:hypothetical protein [Sulfuriferula multivorans]